MEMGEKMGLRVTSSTINASGMIRDMVNTPPI